MADAGPDQTVAVGTMVYLDGSRSGTRDEEEDDPLRCQWSCVTIPAGSQATLSDAQTVNSRFVADLAGTYTVELVVQQEDRISAPDTVVISTANSAPAADAGPNQSLRVGSTAQLDGSRSSDVDNDPLTYQWSLTNQPAGSQAVLSNASSVNPSFVVDKPGLYSIQLIVNDGFTDSSAAITLVKTENSPPVAQAGHDQSAFVNDRIILDWSASSDVDGDPLSYTWTLLGKPPTSTAMLSDDTALKPGLLIDKPGVYVAQLIVHDPSTDSDPDSVIITTENSRPIAQAGPDQTVPLHSLVQLDGSASTDADGDLLRSGVACTTGVKPSQMVQSSSENDT